MIIVIGILATLVLIAYNNIQVRARNVQALDAAKSGFELMNAYYGANGTYPAITNGQDAVCLGNAFKDYDGDGVGDCWDANGNGSDTYGNVTRHVDAGFNATLKSMGRFNDSATYPALNPGNGVIYVGPVFVTPAHVDSSGHYSVRYWQYQETTCPLGTLMYTQTNKIIECALNLSDH